MKVYTVGTFYNPTTPPRLTLARISAYTTWYSPEWAGCIEYEVQAESADDARKEARCLRLAHERRQGGE